MVDDESLKDSTARFFIRQLEFSDIPQVLKILQQLSQYTPDGFSKADYVDFLEQNLCARVAVCSETDAVVGYGSVVFSRKIRLGLQAYIEDVSVEPSYQRAGVGKMLVNELISLSRSKGAYKVTLSCKATNINFYRKNGFEAFEISMRLVL